MATAKECRQQPGALGVRTHSSLGLQGAGPCQHLDAGPVRLMLNFWPPGCERIHFCCSKPAGLWYYDMAATGNEHTAADCKLELLLYVPSALLGTKYQELYSHPGQVLSILFLKLPSLSPCVILSTKKSWGAHMNNYKSRKRTAFRTHGFRQNSVTFLCVQH